MAGIYIHIPFCKQACYYCDFHFSTSLQYKAEMLDALISEIKLQKTYLAGETIETIYFGGGTPSLLQPDDVNRIINELSNQFELTAAAEITLEANPDDLDILKVRALRQTPINRFSVGIQSFYDEDLFWMNRAHRSAEAESSVKRVQDAGFENITVDLIFGYPLLTDEKWSHNIETVFGLNVPHVSAYSMTVEPKTALASFINKKIYPPLNEQQSAKQYLTLAAAMRQQGFDHYEISNYAKPGNYSKHNTNYWRGVKYLGLGPSAHSYNGEARQWNVPNNAKYIADIIKGEIPAESELLTEKDRLNEYTMTSLRTMWGLDLTKLEGIAIGSSTQLLKPAEQYIEQEWIFKEDNKLFLTEEGQLYADTIAADLFF